MQEGEGEGSGAYLLNVDAGGVGGLDGAVDHAAEGVRGDDGDEAVLVGGQEAAERRGDAELGCDASQKLLDRVGGLCLDVHGGGGACVDAGVLYGHTGTMNRTTRQLVMEGTLLQSWFEPYFDS